MKSPRWVEIGFLSLCLFCSAARGSESDGISVSGTGEVLAKPNRVEIQLQTAGSAELTADALVKYREALKRTVEAFEKLKLEDLKVEQRDLGVEAPGANPQAAAGIPQPPAQIQISRSVRLVLSGVNERTEAELADTLGKLLDTAKDAGAAVTTSVTSSAMARMFGQQVAQTLVKFVVDDVDSLRQQAYAAAFQQAQARAERLAALTGARLGRVVAVEESMDVPGDERSVQERLMAAVYGIGDTSSRQEGRVTADRLAEIPIRVTLRVRFAIEEGTVKK